MDAPHPLDGNRVFDHVRQLVSLGARRTGTAAGRAAAEYVAKSFDAFGLSNVSIDRSASTQWDASAHDLCVANQQIDCFPVNHSCAASGPLGPFGTRETGLTRRLIDMNRTTHYDSLADAIVIFDVRFGSIDVDAVSRGTVSPSVRQHPKFRELLDALPDGRLTDPYRTTLAESVTTAVAAGAVGFVAVLSEYFDSNRYINEDYDGLDIPGVWVTKKEGRRIRELLADKHSTHATLHLKGLRSSVTAHSTIGVLPGRSKETILVHSHHDSVSDGAVEDASGTACVLALAEHFSSVPFEQRDRTIMFATMDTHFTGYEAHQDFVLKYIEQNFEGCKVLVNVAIEHIARAARIDEGNLVVEDSPEPRLILTNTGPRVHEIINAAIEDLPAIAVVPTDVLPSEELPTDADFFYQAGIPVISFISAPIYLYDQADTLDKVDESQLGPVSVAFAEIIRDLGLVPREDISQPTD